MGGLQGPQHCTLTRWIQPNILLTCPIYGAYLAYPYFEISASQNNLVAKIPVMLPNFHIPLRFYETPSAYVPYQLTSGGLWVALISELWDCR
jgi:hypothetical protein